jgi:two-component system chemotaxis response regulator CheB
VPGRVVAFASSAGGLAALKKALADLPADLDAPVLVVQHLHPRHRSWMAEILRREVRLAVQQAHDGDLMQPGKIFIAPPDRHLLAGADGVLSLSDTALVQYVRPSADILFESLAESFGPRVIAVVLSGTGSDGARGVRAVKEKGGTVLVQAHAEHTGMPAAAIRTGAADRVLPLEEIGRAVAGLVRAPSTVAPERRKTVPA